jgi:DHA2 family multidrug resistance protein
MSIQTAVRVPAAADHSAAAGGAGTGLKTWIAVIGALLGAFMAVLNIQITNASLPQIQGGIGAGIDDGGWVVTAYLIGEIVVIPLSDFMSRVFSVRRYLITNAALFLLFSAACAFAPNLDVMVVLRGLQGFAGGVLIPMALTIVMTLLPKSRQPAGLAMFAVTATFAPAIGPTVGGYLTETLGWQYIFYLNLVPGVVMISALIYALEPAPMQLRLLKTGDWPGVVTMAVGLTALQTILEDGNKNDWFGSPYIVRLAAVAAVALTLFVVIEFTTARPLVNLRLLARRNFGVGTLSNALLGFGLYGSSFLLSLYLSQAQGYNSEQVGSVMAWVGLPQLLLIPLLPTMLKRVDARWLVIGGLVLFGGSFLLNIHMSQNYAGPQLIWANIVRAVGQAMVLTPLTLMTTAGIERENAGSASGLFNMMRNLGGAIGTAVLQTFLTKREQFHSAVINTDVTVFDEAARNRIAGLQSDFLAHGIPDPQLAWHKAAAAVGRSIHQQALIMGYSDSFFLLASMVLLAALAALFLKKAGRAGGMVAH